MKRFVLAVAAVAVIAIGGTENASATQPTGYPFFPFGFYQPYGAQYRNAMPTPPYFSLNPPVYYGARHARPYGMSPFASPPMVSPAENYRGRLRTDFYLPEVMPTAPADGACSSCVSRAAPRKPAKIGLVQNNPFMSESQLASN